MSNFGIRDLRVVRPWEAAFRDAKSAVGAAELLRNARECPDVAEAIADCGLVVGTSAGSRNRDTQHPIYRLEAGARLIRQSLQNRVAILFGSEKFGLSNDDLSYCNWLMHIPTREEHLSMNLGQAVAVSLYELVRDPGTPLEPCTRPETAPPTAAQTQVLIAKVLELLEAVDYRARHPRANIQQETRRLIRRMHLNARDTEGILGMLRQTLWKIGKETSDGSDR